MSSPMAEVIARVRKEMQDRLREIEAELRSVEGLIAEKARLERALAAPPFAPEGAAAPRRPRGPRAAAPRRPRAPRGANREAVYAALRTMPGASVAEIAAAAGIGRTQVHGVLRAGVKRGELVAGRLPGGQQGYRIHEPGETAFPPASEPAPEIRAAATEVPQPAGPPRPPVQRIARPV